ncbi:MAG: hypothetical protein JSS79_18030 [Bacteroidetes bacterium]|nr:hypothetical protein [Bacteroidota bacterium]
MLPTLRIKADNSLPPAKTNSTIQPTTGVGLTFVTRHFALQVPFYYNPHIPLLMGSGMWG